MPRAAVRPKATAKRAPTTRAFLFSDLREYTSFVEGHGDAAAAKLLREYRTLVRKEVSREHGAEVKTEGDSFYVVFESAVSALDCAVAILRRAEAHNAKDPLLPLRIAIGLHAGDTVEYDKQYVGSAVNIAARIVAKAGEGELLVSDTLRGLVRTGRAYSMTDRGQLKLKGVSERVRGWLVDWHEATAPAPKAPELVLAPTVATRVAPPSGQMLCPTVVGRDAEVTQIAERLDRALAGDGSTIVLGGDAGVGKSALVRRAQDLAAQRGFRLLTGLTLESSSGLAYAPFVSAVRSGFRGLERERLGRVLAQVAPALAQLFPELGRQATRPEPPSGLERHRLSVAFQQLLLAFTREAPVLLVLEDLHWADEASLELLGLLARELRDARALVVATYRSDELHRRHPFLRALANLQRERLVTTVALRRLSREEVGELIRLTFQREQPVTDEFRDAIYARTEGNPFFTEELLKALVESGELFFDQTLGRWTRGTKAVDELKIPDSIVDAVRGRLERLSADALATLATAAVIGQRFSFELLVKVRGAPVADIEAHLREFIEQQLIAEHSGEEDAYAFRHALSREVVYDDLLISERKRLHAAVADALVAVAGIEPSLLAHHLIAAGENTRAVPPLLDAAARALRADAPRGAVAHYERAIEIGVAEGQRAAVLEELARAYLRFDVVRGAKVAEEAVSRYRELGDRRGQSRALRLASRAWYLQGDGAKTTALGREAIDVLDGLDESVELGQAIAALAGARMTDGAYDEAHALADRAITIGERFQDWWTMSNALITKGSASRVGDTEESIALTLRGRDMAVAHDLPETAIRAYNNAAVSLFRQLRPPEERLAFIDEGIAYAKQHGLELLLNLPQFRAQIDFGRGEWDAAIAAVQRYGESTPGQEDVGLGWVAFTTQAREGPRVALPLALRQAERGVRRQEGQSFVPAVISAAAACALAGEPQAARSWIAKLRDRLDSDPAAAVHLSIGGPSWAGLLIYALMLDEPEWLDRAEQSLEKRHEPLLQAGPRAQLRAARAIFDRDSPSCARALDGAYDTAARLGFESAAANMAILLAVDARRRNLDIGPEWDPLLTRVRAFAERTKATWWLQELDQLRN